MGSPHGNFAGTEGDHHTCNCLCSYKYAFLFLTCVAFAKVSFITPQEAVFAQQRGVPIIDVRPAIDHSVSRIPGAIGIPFMRSITGLQPQYNSTVRAKDFALKVTA